MTSDYIVLDIETTGLSALYDNGRVTCICAKDSKGNRFSIVQQDEEDMIMKFLGWLYEYDPDKHALVTFNGKAFDAVFLYVRICELRRKHPPFEKFKAFRHWDLFDEYLKKYNHFISLNKLGAKLGVPVQKCGDGREAIQWWYAGQWKKLQQYCEQDVEVTEQVMLKWSGMMAGER